MDDANIMALMETAIPAMTDFIAPLNFSDKISLRSPMLKKSSVRAAIAAPIKQIHSVKCWVIEAEEAKPTPIIFRKMTLATGMRINKATSIVDTRSIVWVSQPVSSGRISVSMTPVLKVEMCSNVLSKKKCYKFNRIDCKVPGNQDAFCGFTGLHSVRKTRGLREV